jgi:glycosyltransferase involved in cell wall biosynthesis
VRIALLDPPGFTPPYDHSLAAALAERGHDVHLFTAPDLHGSSRSPDGYVRHETFLLFSSRLLRRRPRARVRRYVKGVEYPPSVWRTERALARLAPDVVHVQWLPSPRFDVRWLANVVGRYPTVFTAHDVFTRRPRSAEAWGAALGLVDRVVVHSDRAVEQLAELGVARRRLARILHPVFTDGAGAESAGEPAGQTLLFFGLVREYKGLDVLLRALPEIVGRVPGARLVVAGEPLESAAPLLALADELELNGAVEWRLHFVREQEMAELFAAAACAVLPYRELDSSGVLAMALGHGRPAVVTDVGSLGTIVREYGAGLVVPPEDPAALAAACVELLSNESSLAEAAAGARAARGALTWETAAAEHERLYDELLAERS